MRLREAYEHLLPPFLQSSAASRVPSVSELASCTQPTGIDPMPHGTTILALRYRDGVLIAGDRQATAAYEVAERNIQKVFETDTHSAIAIAGIAGPAMEMAKLLRTQLEFYEKVEGTTLSLEGKANYLSLMLRRNLPAAMQGLIVVPIFAGYDLRRRQGRIFKYDLTGGRYEERDYFATGSGGKDARATLKKRYGSGLTRDDAVRCSVEALLDASDEDLATGGFDFVRSIFPIVKVISEEGMRDVPDEEIRTIAEAFLEQWRADHTARRAPNNNDEA